MKRFSFRFLLMAFLPIFIVACSSDDDDDMDMDVQQNIVELASDTESLSTLVAAVVRADLAATLSGAGPFTVLAPTNDAFETFLQDAGFANLEEVPVDVLTQILLNHVIAGDIRSTDLSTGYASTLAVFPDSENNLSLYVDTEGGVTFNGVSNVSTADVEASNGVVHIVDAVIGLPTVTTFAASNSLFDILVQVLTRSDLTTNYAEVLSGDGPFTVFAPTNAAFVALLEELELSSLDDVPADLLEQVLQYHVVPGANVRAGDLSNGQEVNTLQGDSFTINLGATTSIVDARDRTANIILNDVQSVNGVVHVIDRVILPGE